MEIQTAEDALDDYVKTLNELLTLGEQSGTNKTTRRIASSTSEQSLGRNGGGSGSSGGEPGELLQPSADPSPPPGLPAVYRHTLRDGRVVLKVRKKAFAERLKLEVVESHTRSEKKTNNFSSPAFDDLLKSIQVKNEER